MAIADWCKTCFRGPRMILYIYGSEERKKETLFMKRSLSFGSSLTTPPPLTYKKRPLRPMTFEKADQSDEKFFFGQLVVF